MRYINQKRLLYVYIFIILLTSFIFFRLYTIALSDFGVILPALNNQHSRSINIAERRGFIFDRNGEIIAGTPGLYNTLIDPSKIGLDAPETIYCVAEHISYISDICDEYILSRLKGGVPFIIQTRDSLDSSYASSFLTHRRNSCITAVHILGYLNYNRQGATGLESVYNNFLEDTGARVFGVFNADAINRSLRSEPIRTVDTGYANKTGLGLTIDWRLQEKIERIADEHLDIGAILIADIKTGEILASVSRPVFSLDNLAYYINSERGEFINRAFASFTPGSVFKTIIAAAALEMYPGYLDFIYNCEGVIDVFGQRFRCNRLWGHGELCMTEAYAESCNPYFMALALKIGYNEIYSMSRNLGIGEFSSLDGLNVSRGNIPHILNPPPALVANTAIGQGELLITPLEATRIFAAIANGGIMPELSLVQSLIFENRTADLRNRESRRVLSARTVYYLNNMAREVVSNGTGTSAEPAHSTAAGKTSSAESGQFIYIKDNDGELTREQVIHSWFAGYYPAYYPRYAITVIAEGGVNHDVHSAAIFRKICEYLGESLD